MKRAVIVGLILAVVVLLGVMTPFASAQNDDLVLYGVIGQYLVTINAETGDATEVAMFNGEPVDSITDIAYDWDTSVLYGLARTGGSRKPRLVTIDVCTAEVTIIGTISYQGPAIPTVPAFFAEGLAINPEGTIYVSMSIDGDVNLNPPDVYSEKLATVNPSTAEATLLATIDQEQNHEMQEEADGLEFVSSKLFAADVDGSGRGYFYEVDLGTNVGNADYIGQIYSSDFKNVGGDMAYNYETGLLYGYDSGDDSSNCSCHLCTIDSGNVIPTDIGLIYTSDEFDGGAITGLAWGEPCESTVEESYIYSVKFLCGDGDERYGVEPAEYATAINIHNYLDVEVTFEKKVVIALGEYDAAGGITAYKELPLGPNGAMEIDCNDICRFLEEMEEPITCERFMKGFVVIESTSPLNVVAVYTARSECSDATSIDIEPISPAIMP